MRKILLSVAPVSAAATAIDPQAIAEDVYRCYQEGAAMVHLHVRDANGRLTDDLSLLTETANKIREKCDIVIEISTGGVSELTIEQRCAPCRAAFTEMVSLNVGSVNLGEAVYKNPIGDVRYCVRKLLENKKRPEVEVFELGMIHTVKELDQKFGFCKPLLFALVFGHAGEMPATLPALKHMVEYLYECFPQKDEVLWGYTQAGRKDWQMMQKALEYGASSLRIGFEDSDFLEPQKQAEHNYELIARAAGLIHANKFELMTPAETRTLLCIGKS